MDSWSLLDRLPEAVVVVDVDGVVVAANDRAEAVLGVPAEAAGRRVEDVLDLRDGAGNRWRPAGTGDREQLLTVPGRNDARVAVATRGGEDGYTLTARAASGRGTSDTVAVLAHDLRSPLTSVKGFTRTLLRRWDRFDDDQRKAMLATVEADADRVAHLLQTLVEVVRIDVGEVRLRRAPVDLVELAREVVAGAQATNLGADRTMTVVADQRPAVTGDADKLRLALAALVANALAYAPQSDVTIRIAEAGDGVHLTVEDHGPGVPAADAERLFDRFERGEAERRPGPGLGLYLVRGLIEAHGGRVGFDPDRAVGAAVHVVLPTAS